VEIRGVLYVAKLQNVDMKTNLQKLPVQVPSSDGIL